MIRAICGGASRFFNLAPKHGGYGIADPICLSDGHRSREQSETPGNGYLGLTYSTGRGRNRPQGLVTRRPHDALIGLALEHNTGYKGGSGLSCNLKRALASTALSSLMPLDFMEAESD